MSLPFAIHALCSFKLRIAEYATRKSAIPIDIIVNAGQEMDTVRQRIQFQLYWSVEDEDKADEK